MSKLNFREGITAGALKRFPAFIIAATIILFSSVPSFAYTQFDTNRFDVTFSVEEDATIRVTENIQINANEPMHGIYRYIPLSGDSYIEKGGQAEEIRFNMKVTDVKVEDGQGVEIYQENGNAVIKIGSGHETFTGIKNYTISYKCTLYEDSFEDMDILFANVLPHGWQTAIGASNITVQMPKDFNSADAWMYMGEAGVAGDYENFTVQNNEITASFENLAQGEGVTVLVTLPEGYFEGAANFDWAIPAAYGAAIIAAIIALLLFMAFGRDKPLVRTVEFYPPENLNPAEMGYVIDGVVDKNDIISMIFYFAEKGWLRIEEREEKATGIKGFMGKKEKNVYLVKEIKAVDEDSFANILLEAKSFEKTLFDGIFSQGNEVSIDEFPKDFYEYYKTASEQLKGQYSTIKKNRLFTGSSKAARVAGILLSGVPFSACIAGIGWASFSAGMIVLGVVSYILTILASIIASKMFDKQYAMKKARRVLGYAIAIILCFALPLIALVAVSGAFLMFFLSAICTIAIVVFTSAMLKRTDGSIAQLGKILGFKDFINIAEKDRIEKLSAENPKYFYNILPYAYVFGLTKVWADKFEGIRIEPPTWYNDGAYDGASLFNTWIFVNMFNSTASAMSSSIINIPSAESMGHSDGFPGGFGGFGGGGGFSGGGFGGGGGGGW